MIKSYTVNNESKCPSPVVSTLLSLQSPSREWPCAASLLVLISLRCNCLFARRYKTKLLSRMSQCVQFCIEAPRHGA